MIYLPEKVQIEPTNRCNCRCGFCRRTHWSRPEGDLSFTQYCYILDQLKGVTKIHLQGQGEPLLNPDLAEMIKETRKRGVALHFNTNASLFTEGTIRKILDAGVTRINCSLDSMDPSVFSHTRPGPGLSVIVRKIEQLASLREHMQCDQTSLAIAAVATKATISGLPDIVRFAAETGFDLVYVQNVNYDFSPYGYQVEDRPMHEDFRMFTHYFDRAKTVASKQDIDLYLPQLQVDTSKFVCGWPFKACNITWDGYVSLCCLEPDPEVISFGNVFEDEFHTIWTNSSYQKFRSNYLSGNAPVCRTCPALHGNMWHRDISLLH